MLTQKGSKENARKPRPLWDETRTRCGYNNSKVCAPTLSTMPGTPETIAENASKTALALYENLIKKNAGKCGTCAARCPGCYAMALKAYTDVFEKYLLNTLELWENPARFYALVEKELYADIYNAPRVVRMHEAGEFCGAADIAAFLQFAMRHPETRFFGYSKDEKIQEMQKAGTLPENVKFACSPWITENGIVLCAPIGEIYQYIYNDGTNRAHDKLIKCPCSNPDGTANKNATCVKCGRCIRCKDGEKTAVFPHGVGLAHSWLAGRARLYMRDFSLSYTDAAAAAYSDALKQAAKTWADNAAADIENRVKKLAKALRAADATKARDEKENALQAAD